MGTKTFDKGERFCGRILLSIDETKGNEMKELDIRKNITPIPSQKDLRVWYGRNDEYLIAEEGDDYIILSDEDGDRVRIYNTDIDVLIRALQAMKGNL